MQISSRDAVRGMQYIRVDKASFVISRSGVLVQSPRVTPPALSSDASSFGDHVLPACPTSSPRNNGSRYTPPQRDCFLPLPRTVAVNRAHQPLTFFFPALDDCEFCAVVANASRVLSQACEACYMANREQHGEL